MSELPSQASSPLPPDVCDVWSHWGSKYRARAIVLLALNVILFAGVGNFAFWIRSGTTLAPTLGGYWDEFSQTFRFWGGDNKSLGSLLLEPISVQDVPMQIPILGLLMAALISIPILVSLLYRFWASIPFIAIVCFLAVMPWLAMTLILSCVIASVRPFRSRYPLMSALFGTIPAVLYLILASKGTSSVVVGSIEPIDRIKFFAPWVLAIVASTVVYAVVLSVARLVKFRPGTTTPLLAVMFGLPVILFEWHVGRDELHYRLLESLHAHHFQDVDTSIPLAQRMDLEWKSYPLPRPSYQEFRREREMLWPFELSNDTWRFENELVRKQLEVVDRCDWFLKQFPSSRYASNALYIKACTLDMRVASADYRATRWIRYYDDFPSAASRRTWSMLAENFGPTLLGGVAQLRLAQFAVRECDVDRALTHLNSSINTLNRHMHATSDVSQHRPHNPLLRRPAEASLDVGIDGRLLDAARWKSLIESNKDAKYGAEPLCGPRQHDDSLWFGFVSIDPRSEHYLSNLRVLLRRFPDSMLTDNMELELASRSGENIIGELEELLNKYGDFDSAPEALYRLGLAYLSRGDTANCDIRLGRLIRQFPDSVWAERARVRARATGGTGLMADARYGR